MLTTEASGLIFNTAMGLFKLVKRIDLLWTEKEALQKPLALPLPAVALGQPMRGRQTYDATMRGYEGSGQR